MNPIFLRFHSLNFHAPRASTAFRRENCPLSAQRVGFLKYNTPMTKILYRAHAVQRMFEREISASKVRRALEAEDVIEDYSAETPKPSRLILGFQGKRPFHVVTSENPEANEITVITVYLPDADKWKKDFRSRK
ncbi:MAG: DUF4258 domain-containing protein [Chloroflexi bacterium]|nr:DUF4258 domain-containing protein [Chloroflexota bacterium]